MPAVAPVTVAVKVTEPPYVLSPLPVSAVDVDVRPDVPFQRETTPWLKSATRMSPFGAWATPYGCCIVAP